MPSNLSSVRASPAIAPASNRSDVVSRARRRNGFEDYVNHVMARLDLEVNPDNTRAAKLRAASTHQQAVCGNPNARFEKGLSFGILCALLPTNERKLSINA
jgi:hypothetical protein